MPIRKRKLLFVVTLFWLALFFLLGPLLSPFNPERLVLDQPNLSPSWQHPGGTDQLGRDVLARVLAGGRVSLTVGFLASLTAVFLGTMAGVIAGSWGGDWLLMALVDVLRSIPALILLLFWQSLSTPSLANVILVIALVSWISTARVIRSEVLSLQQREHILAAKAIGCPNWLIFFHHLLPYFSDKLWVLLALEFSGAILLETTLSFLGLGLPANQASWGNMLSDGQNALLSGYWWQVIYPGFACIITLLIIHFWGEDSNDRSITRN